MKNNNSSFLGIKLIDLSTDDTVASAGSDTVQLQPPSGKIYKIIGMYVDILDPSGSSSGSHKFRCASNGMSDSRVYFETNSDSGAGITFSNAGFVATTEQPSSSSDQYRIMHEWLYASNSIPLDFEYANSTDVAQSQTRTLEILVAVYKELI
jgi:hypothetical protein